jgi:hypothetical protein
MLLHVEPKMVALEAGLRIQWGSHGNQQAEVDRTQA